MSFWLSEVMRTKSRHNIVPAIIDRQSLQSLGVLVPLRFNPIKVMPGRHPLGRSGDGMRLLHTRPYIAGEDNPRDIDKYSPPDRPTVMEWEDEAQASIMLLADISASMALANKAALRNACLLQLTYSLWRAGDRVATTLFDNELHKQIRAANLKTQMERLAVMLSALPPDGATDVTAVLQQYLDETRHRHSDLIFVLSDFVSSDDVDVAAATDWRPILHQLQRNIVPVIVSFEVPQEMLGLVKLYDPERKSRRLTWFSRSRIGDINRQERERTAKLISGFRSAGLDYMLVLSQFDIYPQLARLARMRRQRKH